MYMLNPKKENSISTNIHHGVVSYMPYAMHACFFSIKQNQKETSTLSIIYKLTYYKAGASQNSRLIFITADCLWGKLTSPSL